MSRIWVCNSDVRKRVIAGKDILLNVRNNRLLLLNEQASVIWDHIIESGGCRESSIVQKLQCEYQDISVEKIKTDLVGLLFDLEARGFIYQKFKPSQHNGFSSKESSYDAGHLSFSEDMHELAVSRGIPVSCGFEITQHCQLKCIHCYIDDQPLYRNRELSTKEVCGLLEQLVDNGCLWLLITGGEPMLRSDFSEIYSYAKELGMIITVFTNATLFDKRVADVFAKYPPFLVEATIHGSTEATFDTIAGVPGSFYRFRKGIQFLKEYKIPFHLKMIVMRQNVHEVESTQKLALEMGANDFRFDPMINADFHHSSKASDMRITVEEAVKLDLIEPYKDRWEKIYQKALDQRNIYQLSQNFLFPCRAGRCSFTISADGQLLPCVLMRTPSYDLREIIFLEGWQKLNNYVNSAYMKKDNPCLKCTTQTCSKCPAWGYLEHGDPNAKSSFACALQQKREEIFLSK